MVRRQSQELPRFLGGVEAERRTGLDVQATVVRLCNELLAVGGYVPGLESGDEDPMLSAVGNSDVVDLLLFLVERFVVQ